MKRDEYIQIAHFERIAMRRNVKPAMPTNRVILHQAPIQPQTPIKPQPVHIPALNRNEFNPTGFNPLNSFFDKIYCINLDKRKDRWAVCLQEFKKHNLKVERLPGVVGKIRPPKSDLSGGRLGCAYSHLGALKKAVQHRYSRILVLEDDVQFVDDFTTKMQERMPHIPKDFDILYFGGNNPQIIESVNPYVYRIKNVLTLHAYAVTLSFARYMIPKIEPMEDAVDCIYRKYTPDFKCYIFMPYLATQRPDYSDIEERFTDYEKVLNEEFKNIDL